MARALEAKPVEGIGKVYILKEPDLGGETFVSGYAKRLRPIGWTGESYVLTLPQGIKDLNELHKANASGFEGALDSALKTALPIPDPSVEPHEDARKPFTEHDAVQTEILLELAEDIELFHDPN